MSLLVIDADSHNQRIDNFLAKHFKVPRSLLYRLIRSGHVHVNEKKVSFTYKLQKKDIVAISRPIAHDIPKPHQEVASQNIVKQIEILYEDPFLFAVSKPSGIACHGGSQVSVGLIEAIRQQNPQSYFELIHRLDRSTSGLILVAKKRGALANMQKLFALKKIRKTYLCVVSGRVKKNQDILYFPLTIRKQEGLARPVWVDKSQGKPATTHIHVLDRSSTRSLVKAHPQTGRTHQIRVHLSHIGHPIIGDARYNDEKVTPQTPRLLLHAYRIEFHHPVLDKAISILAPLPDDFERELDASRLTLHHNEKTGF